VAEGSSLQAYTVSDFLEWHRQKTLILNPYFQRRGVWSPAAKSFLIDTILRNMPVPKLYLRTKIDPTTSKTIREVVDGQQRLRAIIEYREGAFALDKRAAEFSGLKFDMLNDDQRIAFLKYQLGVDQLINATDDDVLEVFSRLNSYTVTLNGAEKRHALYQGDFKWAIYESARKWRVFWENYKVVTVSQRLRMLDDALMAEFYYTILDGPSEGGEAALNRLYSRMDKEFAGQKEVTAGVDRVLRRIDKELGPAIEGSLAKSTHFLMVFAAVAHATIGLSPGIMDGAMPARSKDVLSDPSAAISNLLSVESIISADSAPETKPARDFWVASRSTTQRASSRRVRFPVFFEALKPGPISL
jgi:hypothetical protein